MIRTFFSKRRLFACLLAALLLAAVLFGILSGKSLKGSYDVLAYMHELPCPLLAYLPDTGNGALTCDFDWDNNSGWALLETETQYRQLSALLTESDAYYSPPPEQYDAEFFRSSKLLAVELAQRNCLGLLTHCDRLQLRGGAVRGTFSFCPTHGASVGGIVGIIYLVPLPASVRSAGISFQLDNTLSDFDRAIDPIGPKPQGYELYLEES